MKRQVVNIVVDSMTQITRDFTKHYLKQIFTLRKTNCDTLDILTNKTKKITGNSSNSNNNNNNSITNELDEIVATIEKDYIVVGGQSWQYFTKNPISSDD